LVATRINVDNNLTAQCDILVVSNLIGMHTSRPAAHRASRRRF
jgi:hypothetical protein